MVTIKVEAAQVPDLATGNMTIRSNLERQDDILLFGMTTPDQGTYEVDNYEATNKNGILISSLKVVAKFDAELAAFQIGEKMFWLTTDGQPTRNKPNCGFRNDEGYCSSVG